MNISKEYFKDCNQLKEYLEKHLNKKIEINDLDLSCEIKKIDKNDENNILNILKKKNIKLNPLFYK